ncbi:MAG: hypothetical protein COC15_04075 [Legionellales bacterium]|nr:MAG: hypothetical protein COC15_04075 [Legionellales bacterium]
MLYLLPEESSFDLFNADAVRLSDKLGILEAMQYIDSVTYLPDDILTKVDRASMAHGLEARVPLLDHRLIEYAWQLPMRVKVKQGKSKWILREIASRHNIGDLIDRPKMGFGVPIDHWLRQQLKPWAEDLLSIENLQKSGLLNAANIRGRWQEHLSGKRDWHPHLWNILMFQEWFVQYKS